MSSHELPPDKTTAARTMGDWRTDYVTHQEMIHAFAQMQEAIVPELRGLRSDMRELLESNVRQESQTEHLSKEVQETRGGLKEMWSAHHACQRTQAARDLKIEGIVCKQEELARYVCDLQQERNQRIGAEQGRENSVRWIGRTWKAILAASGAGGVLYTIFDWLHRTPGK